MKYYDKGIGKSLLLESVMHERVMRFTDQQNEEGKDLSKPSFKWKCKMIRSGIPKEFWPITFDNFWGNPTAVRLAQKYCRHLRLAREHGFGFLFMGSNGRGKTSLEMVILKEALKQGYSAFYITMPMIFKQIYQSYNFPELGRELKHIIETVDFLAIGELGKDYHRKDSEEFARCEFDVLFRSRREQCLPVLMDTNMDDSELVDTYGESLMSLFHSRLKFIEMKGIDYRKKIQKQEWEKIIR